MIDRRYLESWAIADFRALLSLYHSCWLTAHINQFQRAAISLDTYAHSNDFRWLRLNWHTTKATTLGTLEQIFNEKNFSQLILINFHLSSFHSLVASTLFSFRKKNTTDFSIQLDRNDNSSPQLSYQQMCSVKNENNPQESTNSNLYSIMKEESNNNNNESNTTGNYPNIGQQISVSINIHLYFPPSLFLFIHCTHEIELMRFPHSIFLILIPSSFTLFLSFLFALDTNESLTKTSPSSPLLRHCDEDIHRIEWLLNSDIKI